MLLDPFCYLLYAQDNIGGSFLSSILFTNITTNYTDGWLGVRSGDPHMYNCKSVTIPSASLLANTHFMYKEKLPCTRIGPV